MREAEPKVKYDYTGFIFISIPVILTIVLFMAACHHTKDYTIEVPIHKVSEINENLERDIVGYVNTGYGPETVYDEPSTMTPWLTTFEFTYDGNTYEFEYRSSRQQEDEDRIYLNPADPMDFIFAKQKVSWKELFKKE